MSTVWQRVSAALVGRKGAWVTLAIGLLVVLGVMGGLAKSNPPGAVTMGELLDTSKRVSKANTRLVWGDQQFLEGQKHVKKMPTTNELVIAEPGEKTDGPTVVLLGWTKATPKKEKELLKKP